MSNFKLINMLVSFADLSGFAKIVNKMGTAEIAELISGFNSLVGDIIESNEGEVIKFLGDAAMIVFHENNVDLGVRALLECKEKTEQYMKDQGHNSKLFVTCHFGEVAYGNFGTDTKEFTDIMGKTVTIASIRNSNGFAMTPQVFRKLKTDTRKLFKKHTPSVTYIPVTEYHKD